MHKLGFLLRNDSCIKLYFSVRPQKVMARSSLWVVIEKVGFADNGCVQFGLNQVECQQTKKKHTPKSLGLA